MRGGDFMRIEAIQLSDVYQIDRMVSEGCPVVKNSRFPERAGRIPSQTASGIAETKTQQVKP